MFEFIGDALGAIASGGITGLIGSGISIFGEIKKQKMIYEHEESMEGLKQDGMRLQMDIIAKQAEASINLSEMESFTQSQKNDAASYSKGQELTGGQKWLMVIVDFLRGMIRPSMTIYMTILTTLIYMQVMDLVDGLEGVLDQNLAVQLSQQVILVILYITTTVILWWFGTRQKLVQPPKLN